METKILNGKWIFGFLVAMLIFAGGVSANGCSSYTDETSCEADSSCDWCPMCQSTPGPWNGNGDMCVDAGTCSYSCSYGNCGAECDSSNPCADTDCDGLDGCYEGTYRDYNDVPNTCQDDCTCTSNDCTVYATQVTDNDNDGYDTECDNDCDDTNPNIYPGNSNSYCDCDDSDGYGQGTGTETGYCNDGIDNDCDGLTDCADPDCEGAVRDCGEGPCLGTQTCQADGTWSDCSTKGEYCGLLQCPSSCDIDTFHSTYDYAPWVPKFCDAEGICDGAECVYEHICADDDLTDGVPDVDNDGTADAACGAECDGAGVECLNYCSEEGEIFYYNGQCNLWPGDCTCYYEEEDCDELDGWYCADDDTREYRDYYCTLEGCKHEVTQSEDCDDSIDCTVDTCADGACVYTPNDANCPADGWVDVGDPYDCCDGNQVCTCQDQEYRDWYCDATEGCKYDVTGTQTVKTDCSCDINKCGAECDESHPCANKCVQEGSVWYWYHGGVCTNLCVCSYTEESCDDSDPCTIDTCNADTGCSHEHVDNVPPETTKTYGMPFYQDEEGKDYITSQTPITLTAVDYAPTGYEQCASGVDAIYYRYCFCEEAIDNECPGEWILYKSPFHIMEDSCHLIEYYSVDNLGNIEGGDANEDGISDEPNRQTVYVDNNPPIIHKDIGEPKIEEGRETFMLVEITATDQAVTGDIVLQVEKKDENGNWQPYDGKGICMAFSEDISYCWYGYGTCDAEPDAWKDWMQTHWDWFDWVTTQNGMSQRDYSEISDWGMYSDTGEELYYCGCCNEEMCDPNPGPVTNHDDPDIIPILHWDNGQLVIPQVEIEAGTWYAVVKIKIEEEGDYKFSVVSTPSGVAITPGTWNIEKKPTYITQDTEITLGCYDPKDVCEGTPYEGSCAVYNEEQCVTIAGVFPETCEPIYNEGTFTKCEGTPPSCKLLGYVFGPEKCIETPGCYWKCAVDNVTIKYRYRVDDEPFPETWTEYTTPIKFSEDSEHTLEYYCVDALGNEGEHLTQVYKVDSQPPITTKTHNGNYFEDTDESGDFAWINCDTEIILSCEDDCSLGCCVGGCETYYKIDEGGFIEYTEPITLNEGEYTLTYYSVDALGNKETEHTQRYKVDCTNPVVEITSIEPSYDSEGPETLYIKTPVEVNGNVTEDNLAQVFLGVLDGNLNETIGGYHILWTKDITDSCTKTASYECSGTWDGMLFNLSDGTAWEAPVTGFIYDLDGTLVIIIPGNYITTSETYEAGGVFDADTMEFLGIVTGEEGPQLPAEGTFQVMNMYGDPNWMPIPVLGTEFSAPDLELQLIPAEDGDYKITMKALDKAGNDPGDYKDVVLDNTPPTSNVSELDEYQEAGPDATIVWFDVCWGGDDGDGSGIKEYLIQVNEDGAGWMDWETSDDSGCKGFRGTIGHRYCFRSIATDNLDNVETDVPDGGDTCTDVIAYTAEIFLYGDGWTLISLPIVPVDTSPEEVMRYIRCGESNDNSNLVSVWTYIDGEWSVYHPGQPELSNLDEMTAGYGYWVEMEGYDGECTLYVPGTLFAPGSATPPSRTLTAGWQLIGHYGVYGKPVCMGLHSLVNTMGFPTARWSSLYGYDPLNGQFYSLSTCEDGMYPGEGYWILLNSGMPEEMIYGSSENWEYCAFWCEGLY